MGFYHPGALVSGRWIVGWLSVLVVSLGSATLLAAEPANQGYSPDPTSTIALANLQNQFQAIADQVGPSVVAISSVGKAIEADDAAQSDALNGQRLERILDHSARIVGSGFAIADGSYIVTNEHVIGDATQIWITADDHRVYPAVVIGSDPRADVAVLKAAGAKLPAVKFAAPDATRRGIWTIALGNPYGLAEAGEMSMSVGVVSATARSLPKLASAENRNYDNLIQTTAEINPGNSGGPLFNIKGEVIGINSAVILPQKSTNGIGFALPATSDLLGEIEQLRQGKEIVYAYLGVMASNPTPRQRKLAGVSDDAGVMIDSVEEDSPADHVLLVGDVVVRLNDAPVDDSDRFVRQIGRSAIDSPVRLGIYRNGQPLTLSAKLRRREVPSVAVNRDNQRMHWHGMLLGPIPANWDFGTAARPVHGLMIIEVETTSPLLKQGIRTGSILTSVAGRAIDTISELQKIVNDTPAEQCALQFAATPRASVAANVP